MSVIVSGSTVLVSYFLGSLTFTYVCWVYGLCYMILAYMFLGWHDDTCVSVVCDSLPV